MFRAIRQGLRHLFTTPGLVLLLWLGGLVVALPGAVVVEEAIHDSVGDRLVRESLAKAFDTGWYGEFKANAEGLASTLAPSHVGVGAILDVLEGWWSGSLFAASPEVIAFGVVFSLVWLFLLGGVLSRLRRPWDRFSLSDILADGNRFFWRFLRLTIVSAPIYYGIFRLAAWLFPWIAEATRDVTRERTILFYNIVAALLVVLLLTVVKLVIDYARISMVLEGRQSALAAALRGLGFVSRRLIPAMGIVVFFAAVTGILIAVYGIAAPGVGESTPVAILLAIAGSQLFILMRIALKLGLLSSELAFFEERSGRRL